MTSPSCDGSDSRLLVRPLGGFYRCFAQPVGWLILRVFVGAGLILEGWPKINAPFAMAGFVEGIGFYPGWFWSPLLAVLQFFGGIALVVGFLTRPVAFLPMP
ncbi:MAG: DoxX family protein [Pseudorhodoplanes sp.]|nr:DoxX family protein [Pseudorhodoplanes sp.]